MIIASASTTTADMRRHEPANERNGITRPGYRTRAAARQRSSSLPLASYTLWGYAEDMVVLNLTIEGMSCDHCVRHVTRALGKVPGVTVKHVDVGHATVDYNGQPDVLAAIVSAVSDAGYQAHPEAA